MKNKSVAVASMNTSFGKFFVAVIGDSKNFRFYRRSLVGIAAELQAQARVTVESFAKFVNREVEIFFGQNIFKKFPDFFDFQIFFCIRTGGFIETIIVKFCK
jgi:hypothetical protein